MMMDTMVKRIGKAELWRTDNGKEYIKRGPLNNGDKHWGMRSNFKFMQVLVAK